MSSWIAPRDEDIYIKGCVVLHSLRSLIDNDSLFFGMLRSFYQRHLKSNITTKQFIAHVNAATGRDYGWFFRQYLYDYKVPELNYYFTKGEEGDVFHYCWKNTGGDFVIPLKGSITEKSIDLYPAPQWQELPVKNRKTFTLNTSLIYYSLKQIKNKICLNNLSTAKEGLQIFHN